MTDYFNDTRIEFDNNLKRCILNMPNDLKNRLLMDNYVDIQPAQQEIRDYFVKNQSEINIKGRLTFKYDSCPDFYALLSASIADLSICNNWDDVFLQFKQSNYKQHHLQLINYPKNISYKDVMTCMCSHKCSPENMSVVTNKFTGLNVLIACDCLEKTGIISSYEFKKKVRKNDRYAKFIVEKAYEKERQKNVDYRWKKLISNYIEKIETHRRCNRCEKLAIEKSKPEWFKDCVNCYNNKMVGVCLLKPKRGLSL